MRSRSRLFTALLIAASVLGASRAAEASSILTPVYEAQLETWLGQGNLDFTNIYTKQTGDTSANFHAAANGQGATFTLMEVVNRGNTYIIGGYDPQSWASIDNYNYTNTDPERAAFIYNLTSGVMQTQRLNSDLWYPFAGQYQTYNAAIYGPTFGGGHDLYVTEDLLSGYAYQYSYGVGGACGHGGVNILGTVTNTTPCFTYTGNDHNFTVGALEVYTFAPASSVPDGGATLLMLGTALVVVGATRRRLATAARSR